MPLALPIPLLRRALLALVTVAALLVPALAVPAAPAAAPRAACPMADACPLAAAGACQRMICCAPAGPERPLPLDEAAPAAGPQLVAPPPVVVAFVAPLPPRHRPAGDDRPLHGLGGSAALFTLHASFLI